MEIQKRNAKFSCIIPFYNESFKTIVSNIKEVLKVKEIDSIVVIDDGSKELFTHDILKIIFINHSKIILLRLNNNFGKTFAVSYALKYVSDGNVFLCDSDLKNLNNEQISDAIIKYDLLNLNMLILRRMDTGFFPKIIRADTLLSGERILQKKDLIKVVEANVKDYELEVAINQYFINDNAFKCFWSPSSAINNYKYIKLNFLKGILKDLKMYYNIIEYIGFKNFVNQVLTFCKQNI